MFDGLISWTEATLMPLGFSGVGLLAFIESAFFPVPPEVLLIPLILIDPANAFAYAAVATVASTLGSVLGWKIGKAGGKRLLNKFVSAENAGKAESLFKKYGNWALVISGFTPIPYKVFTITVGALDAKPNLQFLAACTAGRGARFFLEAALLMLYGNEIVSFITNEFGLVTFGILAVVGVVFLLLKRLPR